jgi:hypothetical protein
MTSLDAGLPMRTSATSAAIPPNLESSMCLARKLRIGSNVTSSRPPRAIRKPSRKINSWIRANAVTGRTVCEGGNLSKPQSDKVDQARNNVP